MAGLRHTVLSLGDASGHCAGDNPGVPPRQVEEPLQLLGRRDIRAALLYGTGVAAGGADRRQQRQCVRDGYHEELPAQRPRGLPGHEWGGFASEQR